MRDSKDPGAQPLSMKTNNIDVKHTYISYPSMVTTEGGNGKVATSHYWRLRWSVWLKSTQEALTIPSNRKFMSIDPW
jgi:hypothetical protein